MGSVVEVASTIYNLAGDPAKRTNYKHGLMLSNTLGNKDITQGILDGYLKGPKVRYQSFNRWAQANYVAAIGEIQSDLLNTQVTTDPATIKGQIPRISGQIDSQAVAVVSTSVGDVDLTQWAEQWILLHQPTADGTAWSVDYVSSTNTLTITFADSSTTSFNPTNLTPGAQYLYVNYTLTPGMGGAGSSKELYIYKLGSGNAVLDAYAPASIPAADSYGFFPYIPVRAFKTFLSPTYQPSVYTAAKEAYRKAFNNPTQTFDTLVATLSNNANLHDIDFAYVVFGVSLNVADNSARKYIYTFFKKMMQAQANNGQIRVYSGNNTTLNYDMRIKWDALSETTGSGVYVTSGGQSMAVDTVGFDTVGGSIYLVWQLTANSWSKILFQGVAHHNYVYEGNVVGIPASTAINDPNESGFIVPLEYNVFSATPMVDATQMTSSCAVLVLNSYKIVQKPWYATGIFRIFTFIAALVITYFYPPAGVAALAGDIGATIGTSAIISLILAAAVTEIAAIVLGTIIMDVSTMLFGKKLGAIIGLIVTMAAMQGLNAFMSGQSLAISLPNLMNAANLLQLTIATGQGVAAYVSGEAQDTLGKIGQVQSQYAKETQEISSLYAQNIGYGNAIDLSIGDPQMNGDPPLIESVDTFFARTLMTGSDIAQLSMDLLSNFSNLTLTTDLPF